MTPRTATSRALLLAALGAALLWATGLALWGAGVLAPGPEAAAGPRPAPTRTPEDATQEGPLRPAPRLDCPSGRSWGGIADYAADAVGERTPQQVAQAWVRRHRGDARYVRYRIFAGSGAAGERTLAWYDAADRLTELHGLEQAPRGGWIVRTTQGCG